MEKQKKNDSGITLVALVVSIIVMLVLAGVSLNATIGENGIVTRAQEATLQHKIAEDLEELNLELAKINVDAITSDDTMAIQDIANYLVGQETIDRFVTTSAGQIAAGIDTTTGNKYFFGIKGDNTYKIDRGRDGLYSAILTESASGGDITGGYTLVTADSFNNDSSLPAIEKGKFTITSDAEVVFMDTVSGALSISVADNVHATVGIYADMTLTNQGVKRSAIDISKNNGILDLYIGEGVNVIVNSGLGVDASGNTAGTGGYAGIHVPEGATINIKGSGIVRAYGGNGSEGGTPLGNTDAELGAGGGGAGAGIGGKGGDGGVGARGVGNNGKAGENCGTVNIYGDTVVYAYGGAGGTGGSGSAAVYGSGDGAGGAGGGYPAAGIGGGGAGGAGSSCCSGGGGYSGGSSQQVIYSAKNGLAGQGAYSGGGYFEGSTATLTLGTSTNEIERSMHCLGGIGDGGQFGFEHRTGSGGTAGNGGNISVSKNAKVYAFNGNLYSDNTPYNDGVNQCPIYAQTGKIPDYYQYTGVKTVEVTQTTKTIDVSGYENYIYKNGADKFKNSKTLNINTKLSITTNSLLTNVDVSKQGVGSGAGYAEVSNGTYTRYNVDDNGNFTTVYTET